MSKGLPAFEWSSPSPNKLQILKPAASDQIELQKLIDDLGVSRCFYFLQRHENRADRLLESQRLVLQVTDVYRLIRFEGDLVGEVFLQADLTLPKQLKLHLSLTHRALNDGKFAEELKSWAFAVLNQFVKIKVSVPAPDNKLTEFFLNLGFNLEVRFREHVKWHGEWHDELLLALIRPQSVEFKI